MQKSDCQLTVFSCLSPPIGQNMRRIFGGLCEIVEQRRRCDFEGQIAGNHIGLRIIGTAPRFPTTCRDVLLTEGHDRCLFRTRHTQLRRRNVG